MRRILILTIASALVAAAPLGAQTTVKAMYAKLQAREQAVHKSIEAGRPAESTRKDVSRVVAGYESLVGRFPRSSYSDNALWQAAMLSASSFARYHVESDRTQALKLLKRMAGEYPASPLIRQARPAMARLAGVSEPAPTRRAAVLPVPPPAPAASTAIAADRMASEAPAPPMPVAPLPMPLTTTVASPHPAGSTAALRAVRRTILPDVVRIAIELDREVDFHHDKIANPDRVFVDLHGADVSGGVQPTATWDDGVVKAVRVGARPGGTVRVVLDLGAAAEYSVFTLYNPFRVVVDLERAPRSAALSPVLKASAAPAGDTVVPATLETSARPLSAVATTSAPAVPMPGPSNEHEFIPAEESIKPAPQVDGVAPGATLAPAIVDTPLPAKHAAGAASAVSAPANVIPVAPAQNLQGRFSLSRQLGLGISRIVIDPGHGGHDPGAQTKGLNEADLVLDVSLRLQKLLLKSPGVEVVLTRSTDVFIPLEERTAIANREAADLFLSIHANASRNPSARGVETYFLNFASNPDAEAVAARENSASGQGMHNLPDIVKAITLNNKLDESRDFATLVQRSMVDHLASGNKGVRDLGVKQAPFVVLIGAGMPSVLAEISFVTHAQEGRLLKTGAYRQKIAEALFDGLREYQQSLKGVKAASTATGGASGADAEAGDGGPAAAVRTPVAPRARHHSVK